MNQDHLTSTAQGALSQSTMNIMLANTPVNNLGVGNPSSPNQQSLPRKRKIPDDHVIAQAIAEYRNPQNTKSIRKLASEYGIPKSTLHGRCKEHEKIITSPEQNHLKNSNARRIARFSSQPQHMTPHDGASMSEEAANARGVMGTVGVVGAPGSMQAQIRKQARRMNSGIPDGVSPSGQTPGSAVPSPSGQPPRGGRPRGGITTGLVTNDQNALGALGLNDELEYPLAAPSSASLSTLTTEVNKMVSQLSTLEENLITMFLETLTGLFLTPTRKVVEAYALNLQSMKFHEYIRRQKSNGASAQALNSLLGMETSICTIRPQFVSRLLSRLAHRKVGSTAISLTDLVASSMTSHGRHGSLGSHSRNPSSSNNGSAAGKPGGVNSNNSGSGDDVDSVNSSTGGSTGPGTEGYSNYGGVSLGAFDVQLHDFTALLPILIQRLNVSLDNIYVMNEISSTVASSLASADAGGSIDLNETNTLTMVELIRGSGSLVNPGLFISKFESIGTGSLSAQALELTSGNPEMFGSHNANLFALQDDSQPPSSYGSMTLRTASSQDGFFQSRNALDYFQEVFQSFDSNYKILIVDRYFSFMSEEVQGFLRNNKIVVVFLPSIYNNSYTESWGNVANNTILNLSCGFLSNTRNIRNQLNSIVQTIEQETNENNVTGVIRVRSNAYLNDWIAKYEGARARIQ